eukprot:4317752-Alexandrium_andersonii.AAC.1
MARPHKSSAPSPSEASSQGPANSLIPAPHAALPSRRSWASSSVAGKANRWRPGKQIPRGTSMLVKSVHLG